MSETPVYKGFEYRVRLAVSIPLAWAEFLRAVALQHYDWWCKESARAGVVNALRNTACDSEHPSSYPVAWRDLDLLAKIMEQAQYQPDTGQKWELIAKIDAWIDQAKAWLIARQEALAKWDIEQETLMPSRPPSSRENPMIHDPWTQPTIGNVSARLANPWPMTTAESAPLDASELPLAVVLDCVRAIARSGSGVLTFSTWSVKVTGRFTWRGLTGIQLGVLDMWAEIHRGSTVEGGPIPTTNEVVDVALRVLDDPKLDWPGLLDYRAILVEYTETGSQEDVRGAARALLAAMDARRRAQAT